MPGWLDRLVNSKVVTRLNDLSLSFTEQPKSARPLLSAPSRGQLRLDDEPLRQIIRNLIREPSYTIRDIVALSMTCKQIRSVFLLCLSASSTPIFAKYFSSAGPQKTYVRYRRLCHEAELWRDLCVLHYKAPPRPLHAVPWRELYMCELISSAQHD